MTVTKITTCCYCGSRAALVLRGKDSSFLTEDIANKMLTVGPETTMVEFDGVGHTPTLRNDEQVDVIKDWLQKTG